MPQTADAQCPAPSVMFGEEIYSFRALELQEILVIIGLTWGLYGAWLVRYHWALLKFVTRHPGDSVGAVRPRSYGVRPVCVARHVYSAW